jgi:hypothetical protein
VLCFDMLSNLMAHFTDVASHPGGSCIVQGKAFEL